MVVELDGPAANAGRVPCPVAPRSGHALGAT
jgi:hypothetical protein